MKPNEDIVLINQRKEHLRKKLLEIRRQIGDDLIEMASQGVWSHLQKTPQFVEAQTIAAFASTRNEIDTYPILEGIINLGKKLLLPHVTKNKTDLSFHEIKDLNHLSPGEFGILAPNPIHPFEIDKVDLILVPGLAFDQRGYRLGFGKGYYDRALPHLKKTALSIGLCYSFQVVDQVPVGPLDIPVKALLHEKDLEFCEK
jgi:5-formyltetrahydrofolate cyclo-ligase